MVIFLEFVKYKVDYSALIYNKSILSFIYFQLFGSNCSILFHRLQKVTLSVLPICPYILLNKIKQLTPDRGVKAILFTHSLIMVGKISFLYGLL